MKYYDLSLPIKNGMVVYPGNTEVEITALPLSPSTSSRIVIGSHTGTHCDAPRHVFKRGAGIDALPLSSFIGPCRVLDATHVSECVRIEDLKPHRLKKGERILVKTINSSRGLRRFRDDFIYLDGDAADFLVHKQITLFGIDYLSVKKKGGTDTRPHTSLLKKNIAILEGINLARIAPGDYFLICLPLRLAGLDGSPCRAVLVR